MSEATIEYKNSPNESTAYAVSEGKKTKVQLVVTPPADLELADNPNVDTGYLVINGEKHKCLLVAGVPGELKLPTSATDDSGYVIALDGRQHKVKLVANITGGGTEINNQDINVTQNGIYQAEEGYTGLGLVNVNVASGSPTQKFGASVDTWIGDVDENGVLNQTTWTGALNFAGVKEIATYGLEYRFRNCTGITSVDLSSVQSIGMYSLRYTFYKCTNIISVDFSLLQSIGIYGLYYAFGDCEKLTTISFPSLTSVQSTSFYNAFDNCTALTEIHFRADMQATIEAMDGYSSKFGAGSSCTIYFDL